MNVTNNTVNLSNMQQSNFAFLQIGYDSKMIIKLLNELKNKPIESVEIIPFISLFCWEATEFFKKYDINFEMPNNKTFSLQYIRLKTKLFENKYSKAKKMILNCDYLQDYIFKHQLRFKFMYDWNIHYNLGIFVDKYGNIVGNSQYGYYIFQDDKLLKKKIIDVEKLDNTKELNYEFKPEEYFEYGEFCGKIIARINNFFKDINVNMEVNAIDSNLFYKDLNTNRHLKTFDKDDEGKALTLYLIHILSTINSVIKLLRKYEKTDTGWWLRIYYITYYYAFQRLNDIRNHITMNGILNSKIQNFYSIINIDDKELINIEFRNCMMHYDLIDKNNKFLIKDEYLNVNIPLFGLVESCFYGIKYDELKSKILKKLNLLSTEIQKLLDLNISNPISL